MPVAAERVSAAASVPSPYTLGLSPVSTSMMAPTLVVIEAVVPTCSLLKLTSPTAARVARPLVPSVVMLMPLVMVKAPPAVRAISPPVVAPPEAILPASDMAPAVAVTVTALLAPDAVRSTPLMVVMASAATSVKAPTLVMSMLAKMSSPAPCAVKVTLPRPTPVPGLVTLAAVSPLTKRCVASPVLTTPFKTVTLPPRVVRLISPPLTMFCARRTMLTSPVICVVLSRAPLRTSFTPNKMVPVPVFCTST